MIHSSYYQPRIFPIAGDTVDAEIDRAQSIDPTTTLNREKVEEIGRDGVVGYLQRSPTIGYRLTQLEYGSIEFYQKLINSDTKGNNGQDAIEISDFKTSYFDICAYLTDDDETFKGTVWFPSLRTAGFSITIGEPQGMIERSFDFVGEGSHILQGNNKYFICHKATVESGDLLSGDAVEIDLTSRAPAEDPDDAGTYIFRVVRVRSGVTTELEETTDWAYSNATKVLTISSCQLGDVIKAYYSSATAPATVFSLNNSDVSALLGDTASIYLYVPGSATPDSNDYIYRLQSASIDVRFDREDIGEIGNKNVVARGIRNTTVTVTLGRILESATVEEVLRGVSADYGKIDISKLSDEVALIVKIYTDNTKSTLAYGIMARKLTPTELRGGAGVNEYVRRDNTLEGENLVISADNSKIGNIS
jgi:hypothetical protein